MHQVQVCYDNSRLKEEYLIAENFRKFILSGGLL
jgi:hypothetical protein